VALGRDFELFTQAWVSHLSRVPERGMVALVYIFGVSDKVYDAETDTWIEETAEVYNGPARVQPLRSTRQSDVAGDDILNQMYLVSLPIATRDIDFNSAQTMHVLSSPLNPSLETYVFNVWETGDSSNPLERTLIVQVNQDVRRG